MQIKGEAISFLTGEEAMKKTGMERCQIIF